VEVAKLARRPAAEIQNATKSQLEILWHSEFRAQWLTFVRNSIIGGHKKNVSAMISIFVTTLAFDGSRLDGLGECVKIRERLID